MYTKEKLKELQALPLDDKISLTKLRVQEFYDNLGGVILNFSGGKDSTVLKHIIDSMNLDIQSVFVNTGLEYPDIVSFVKKQDNVTLIRPKMNFKEVIDTYGWVFPSKEIAHHIYYMRRGSDWAWKTMDGLEKDGTPSTFKERNKRWKFLVNAPCKISHKCCDIMKKEPLKRYHKETNTKPIVATLATESMLRQIAWYKTGCNSYGNTIMSKPLSFWTEQDILNYIVRFNVEIAPIYGDIIEVSGKLVTTKESRSGCVFCPVSCHLGKPPYKFQRLKENYPKLYDYCINKLNLKELLDFVGNHLGKELY